MCHVLCLMSCECLFALLALSFYPLRLFMKLRHSIGLASLLGLALAGPTLAMDASFKDAITRLP